MIWTNSFQEIYEAFARKEKSNQASSSSTATSSMTLQCVEVLVQPPVLWHCSVLRCWYSHQFCDTAVCWGVGTATSSVTLQCVVVLAPPPVLWRCSVLRCWHHHQFCDAAVCCGVGTATSSVTLQCAEVNPLVPPTGGYELSQDGQEHFPEDAGTSRAWPDAHNIDTHVVLGPVGYRGHTLRPLTGIVAC